MLRRKPLYFDVTPTDELSELVHFLSDSPRSENWRRTVDTNDAHTVLATGGALSRTALRLFTALSRLDFYRHVNPRTKELESLVSVMEPNIERLYLDDLWIRTFNWNKLFSLRVLIVTGSTTSNVMDEILECCGRNLRELFSWMKIIQPKMIQSVVRYCDSLEVLHLGYTGYDGNLDLLWSSVGDTLREFGGHLGENDFFNIGRHCKRLESLDLSYSSRVALSNSMIECLQKLLTLRFLKIKVHDGPNASLLTPEDVQTLLAVFSSELKVHALIYFDFCEPSFDFFRAFGSRMRMLDWNSEFDTIPNDVLPTLSNLEELTLIALNASFQDQFLTSMKSLFAQRIPKLHKLHIEQMYDSQLIPALVGSLPSLLDLECDYVPEEFNDAGKLKSSHFAKFLQDCTKMRRFLLNCSIDGKNEGLKDAVISEVVDLIKTLRFCTSLREVCIELDTELTAEQSRKIRDACSPMRIRRMDLSIDGVRFLPPPSNL